MSHDEFIRACLEHACSTDENVAGFMGDLVKRRSDVEENQIIIDDFDDYSAYPVKMRRFDAFPQG